MTLPAAPSRTMSQDTFDATTDAFIGALPQFETDMNALAAAMALNATTDTSTSSVAIGTGAKTFTVSAGKSFWPGMWLIIADTAAPTTNGMYVQVTSYSGTTLVVDSKTVAGSGTKASWQISQTAPSTGVALLSGATFTGLVNLTFGANIASAATVDLTAATGNTVIITGTTATSALTMATGQVMTLVAQGAWPLTYNATTMNINGGASYTCKANDKVIAYKDGAGTIHVCVIPSVRNTVIVSATRDLTLASGSVAYTGFGGTPRSIRIFGAVNGTNVRSNGMDNGTVAACEYTTYVPASTLSTAASIAAVTASGANQVAAVSSFASDTVTLNWTKTGSPTGTLSFVIVASF